MIAIVGALKLAVVAMVLSAWVLMRFQGAPTEAFSARNLVGSIRHVLYLEHAQVRLGRDLAALDVVNATYALGMMVPRESAEWQLLAAFLTTLQYKLVRMDGLLLGMEKAYASRSYEGVRFFARLLQDTLRELQPPVLFATPLLATTPTNEHGLTLHASDHCMTLWGGVGTQGVGAHGVRALIVVNEAQQKWKGLASGLTALEDALGDIQFLAGRLSESPYVPTPFGFEVGYKRTTGLWREWLRTLHGRYEWLLRNKL